MTSLNALQRRLSLLAAQVPRPPEPARLELNLSLFSLAEQAELQPFLNSLEHYLDCQDIRVILNKLTNQELDQLHYWVEQAEQRAHSK